MQIHSAVAAVLLLVWTMCLGSCAPQPGASDAADASDTADAGHPEIIEAVERYYADFSARDWDAFASRFWPGATLATIWQPPGATAPGVVITTVPDFVDQAPAGPGSREIFEERMVSTEVTAYGDLAQVWARYEARFGDPGDIAEWRGIDAFTLLRHDGEWKIVSLSYTAEEPPS